MSDQLDPVSLPPPPVGTFPVRVMPRHYIMFCQTFQENMAKPKVKPVVISKLEKPDLETGLHLSPHENNENEDQGLLIQTPIKKEFQEFQNPAPKIHKSNLTDSQTKPGISVNYLEITPQPCNFISEYPRCAQEQETFRTHTEAPYAESETKGYVMGIVANKDSPPEKSMETEATVSMPLVSVGSRDDVDVATDEEEGKDLKSGKKLCKIHDVKPEESEVVEEETKTKPTLESESESSRVSWVFNSRDLKAPTESLAGSLLLLKNTEQKKSEEFAKIKSEPGWRIDDDDPTIATDGQSSLVN